MMYDQEVIATVLKYPVFEDKKCPALLEKLPDNAFIASSSHGESYCAKNARFKHAESGTGWKPKTSGPKWLQIDLQEAYAITKIDHEARGSVLICHKVSYRVQ
eukprot:TRINITY_DN2923_c0_g1_i1.p1 TRINITY_DN2923_c0_g1~~TRINITY_DN2923_c0_g1_i1.p1  ORF type:complete len:103 (-),score=5.78 TRINITY_DN2923_c0_g1_i1:29-337(-)